jgi:hypothetical protein
MWGSLAALLGSGMLKLFSYQTVKYLAFRGLLVGLFLGLGPVVIFSGYSWIMKHMLEYVATMVGEAGMESPIVSVAGLGGWVVTQLRIGEALSIYLSFIALSFHLRMLRAK